MDTSAKSFLSSDLGETNAISQSIALRIHGLDCAEEVALLRRALEGQPGVGSLAFDVVQGKLTAEYNPSCTGPDVIIRAIAKTGLRAEPWQDRQKEKEQGWWLRHGRTVLAATSGVALLAGILEHGVRSGDFLLSFLTQGDSGAPVTALQQALFLIATLAGAWQTFPKALNAVRNRRADMNVLLIVSICGAMVLGEYSEGATVAFLFSIAAFLEAWSLQRARTAIRSLLRITPQEAVVRHGDHEHRVPVEQLSRGSVVLVRPGERIPCDGAVRAGSSAVDQAPLTGESVPVFKMPGDPVYAGSLNGTGSLEIEATREPSDTTLARILRMVEQAQHRRASMEQWVEKFARYYTPAMICLAFLVATIPPLFLGNWTAWFYQSMVVLLISCPCALVISTPVTVTAALTSAARKGVLIKGGTYLEAAARIRAVAFDKTGVLTKGEPEVRRVIPLNGYSVESVLRLLGSIEQRSEHPFARAIARYVKANGITTEAATNIEALPGKGAQGVVDGGRFWVGSTRLAREMKLTDESLAHLEGAANGSMIACGTDKELVALVEIQDSVRPEAASVLKSLRAAGVEKLVMLTGDSSTVAAAVGQTLGIEEVHAELLPEDKARYVAGYRKSYGTVSMVGDGINDTGALAEASVGIALGPRGTDVALETADVVLMSDGLKHLPFLVHHSRRTLRVVKENIAFALALKGAFLVLAAAGMATLWMAIAADTGATLLVTFNGLRLLRTGTSPAQN